MCKFIVVCFFSICCYAELVFRHSELGNATNLDPTQAVSSYESIIMRNIFDTLYTYKLFKRPYELKPLLADGFPEISKDSLTYKIRIKPNIFFKDDACFTGSIGREITANDFVYSLKRHFDLKFKSKNLWIWRGRIKGLDKWKEKGSDYSKEVEGLKAIDKYNISITLTAPYPLFIYTLAMVASSVVPKECVEKYKEEFGIKPVGSGPFFLTSINSQKAVLVKNPKYRKELFNLKEEGYDVKKHGFLGYEKFNGKPLPFIDKIEIGFFNDPDARWRSFLKGNEIALATIPDKQIDRVLLSKKPVIRLKPEYEKKYHMMALEELGIVFSLFNFADERIGYHKDPKRNAANKALRCAIIKAFDWPQRIKRFYFDIGENYTGFIPRGLDGFENLPKINRDVEGAKKLLLDSGWTKENLPVLEYGAVNSVITRQFFEQERSWFKEIGYPVEKIKFLGFANFGDFQKAMKERKVMYMLWAWNLDYSDAENVFSIFYGPNASPGANVANYDNKEFNSLFEKASKMPPSKKRTNIYKKMNKILIDDCVGISGFSRTSIYLWPKNILLFPGRGELGGVFLKYVGFK